MRKFAAVLIGLGAFLLVAGLLLRFYAYPRLAVVPLDQNSQSVVVGENSQFFDIESLSPQTGTITTTVTVIGDKKAGEDASNELDERIAVWDKGSVTDNNDSEPPMTASTERIAFDRFTGEAVDCCDANEDGTPTNYDGLVFKFPFDTQQETYDYWDGSLGKAVPIDFEGTEELNGVETYVFKQDIPSTQVGTREVPALILGLTGGNVEADEYYENVRTIWVEPNTGVMMKVLEQQKQELRLDDKQLTLIDTDSAYTEDTIKENTDTYGPLGSQLKLVHSTIPVWGGIGGILLMVIGAVLGRRKNESDKDAEGPATA